MQDGDVFQGELFRRRIVMVIGVLNEPLALRVAAQLMTLDASGDDPVDMYLDCREGTLEAAFVLIDTLELMQATTRTHALGEVGGPAVGVFAAGRQRVAAPNARFHLSEPKMQANGNADEIVARAEQHKLLLQKFRTRLASATGRSVSKVIEDLEHQRFYRRRGSRRVRAN